MDQQQPSRVGKWPASDVAWMLVVLGLALAVRLYRIQKQPFWLDEVLTLQRIHLGISGLIADCFANRHMPTYFLMLRMLSPFGSGNTWLRLPSAWFGALSAGMVFAIARRVGGRSAAIVAGLLMALSPLQVQYGQEARSYALEILLITVSLWGLIQLTQPGTGANRRGWVTYVLGTIGALDVLGDAVPWLIASNVALLLIWRSLPRESPCGSRRIFLRHWLLGQALIIACCAPFYGAIQAASDGHMLQKFDWIPSLSWHHLWVTAGSVYLMRMAAFVRFGLLPTSVPWLGLLVALLGGAGWFRLRGKLEGRILLLGFVVLPLLLLAVSVFKPVLVPRYILWSAAPFFVLVGVGATALPRRTLPAAVAALVMLAALNLVPVYRLEVKPRWDMAAATLSAQVLPGDTVFTDDPNAPAMLAALQPPNATPIDNIALVTPRFDQALARWKQGGRVWAVNGRSALGERETPGIFKSRMAAMGIPAMQISQGKEITILMFPARVESP
jgi:mannosyltransferase